MVEHIKVFNNKFSMIFILILMFYVQHKYHIAPGVHLCLEIPDMNRSVDKGLSAGGFDSACEYAINLKCSPIPFVRGYFSKWINLI